MLSTMLEKLRISSQATVLNIVLTLARHSGVSQRGANFPRKYLEAERISLDLRCGYVKPIVKLKM